MPGCLICLALLSGDRLLSWLVSAVENDESFPNPPKCFEIYSKSRHNLEVGTLLNNWLNVKLIH